MTPTDKSAFWQQHINQWQHSNTSQKDYCEQHKLSLASFGYWRRRLSTASPATGKLIPVRISPASSPIHIRLPNGIELDVPVAVLEEVLPVLSRSVREHA